MNVSASLLVRVGKAAEALAVILGAFLVCAPLFSQGSYGRILGIVMDRSGGTV